MQKIKCFSTNTLGKKNYLIENEIITPILGGATFDSSKNSNLMGDNTGDNISHKNKSYCELTVQYWAWKNVEADYYGFFHYRRYLSFSKKQMKADNWNVVYKEYLDENFEKELCLNDEDHIRKVVSEYDLITMNPSDLSKLKIKSVYSQFKEDGKRLNIKDLDLILDVIKRKYPAFYPAAMEYIHGTKMYMCNIFIMKKELFFEYSKWLFAILDEFDHLSDMSEYSVEGYRTPGHLGERLFGIYLTYIRNQKKYRVKELQLVYCDRTDAQPNLLPFFEKNNVPIIMAANEKFVPFSSAAIQSIIDTSNSDYFYDIIFFEKNISNTTKEILKKMVQSYSNFSIRFFDVGRFINKYNLFERPNISVETYFRLLIPELLPSYDKVLYIDGDLIVKDDVSKLFNIDIGENFIGGAIDVAGAGTVNGFDEGQKKYYKEKLRLKKIYLQVNAGVLIMNSKKFREKFTSKYLLEFAEAGQFQFQDQDVLNVICEDSIYWLDPAWNFFADEVTGYRGYIETFAPRDIYTAYRNAAKKPKIIHYAGNEKPWYFTNLEWADEFWMTFQKSPFYNNFLHIRRMDAAWHVFHHSKKENLLKKVHKAPRKVADRFFPLGSGKRKILKKMFPFFVRKG